MTTLETFKAYWKKIEALQHAAMLLSWDMECGMPRLGVEAHIASMTVLSSEAFKLSIAPEMGQYLEALTAPEVYRTLDEVNQKMVDVAKYDYDREKHIPVALKERFTEVTSRSQHAWTTAKHANDFETMIPYFEEMITLLKEQMQYTNPGQDAYDALLDSYEKGMDAKKIGDVFEELKQGIVPLIQAIANKAPVDDSSLIGDYDEAAQRAFAYDLLDVLGYSMEAGRLDTSEHPFTTGTAPFDVRITTNYEKQDIRPSAFSVLHEGGHGIYEQKMDPRLVGTGLNQGTSMGIHESQSRFYENMIGRHHAFWEKQYATLVKHFPQYEAISLETFYRAINKVEPSLIRVDADELTYNLHVIIRFELEKALFDGSLAVRDLPQAWHKKMQDYLGVVPANDKEGVLQDVHWPGGMFGYFPSYSLGNIYSGQFLEALEAECGPLETLLRAGKLETITTWLTAHIHQYGKMKTPLEIIQETCGGTIDAQPIIRYYTKKYTTLYGL